MSADRTRTHAREHEHEPPTPHRETMARESEDARLAHSFFISSFSTSQSPHLWRILLQQLYFSTTKKRKRNKETRLSIDHGCNAGWMHFGSSLLAHIVLYCTDDHTSKHHRTRPCAPIHSFILSFTLHAKREAAPPLLLLSPLTHTHCWGGSHRAFAQSMVPLP